MLYTNIHNAMINFENGGCEQVIIEKDEYSLYLNNVNDKIYAIIYLDRFKVDLGEIGNMFQSYVIVADNLKTVLQDISNNLTYLQMDLSC